MVEASPRLPLRAGAAATDISPRSPVPLFGYPHVERVSSGVHDPLLASVVVLANPEFTVVLASLDLLMLEPARARALRKAVAAAAGCDESGVLIGCTHTHSGPVTSRLLAWRGDPAAPDPDPAYLDWVAACVCACAAEAARAMQPAAFAWTTADASGVGGNRLGHDGVTDPDCGILAVRQVNTRRLLAVSLAYGMHPTVLHEDSRLVSGDFPHYARLHVQEHAGSAIPVAYHMGPSGNQSPRRFVRAQTFAEAERLGRKLGAAVCGALDALPETAWQHTMRLAGALRAVSLPRNALPSPTEAECRRLASVARHAELVRNRAPREDVRTAECAVFGAESAVVLARAQADGSLDAALAGYNPAEVQVLRLGELAVVGLPGECFAEYGLEIKRGAPGPALVITLANGELQGYVVTPEAAAAGGYEAANAVFAPQAGSLLVATALSLLQESSVAP